MNVAVRNKRLKALLDLRLGPGAAILPANVKKITLDFAYRIDGGNRGPRKFWRLCLPRLKYYNPGVSMTVNRSANQSGPATLSVFFAQPREDHILKSPPGAPIKDQQATDAEPEDPTNQVESVDMKNLDEIGILNRFLAVTRARPHEASPQERLQLQEVKEFQDRSQADRERQGILNKAKAEQKALLEQAKGAVS